jgi:cation:H+ antiporter
MGGETAAAPNVLLVLSWPAFFAGFREQLFNTWRLLLDFEPWFSLSLFFIASFIMIWRLGALERKGLEGTVLGTLVMPYASGFSNLIFAYIMGRSGQNGKLVLENCLVNNVTNLTLLIGLPALIWGLNIFPERRGNGNPFGPLKSQRLNRLSLLLTLLAVLFFTGACWALSRDGVLDFGDGVVLVGLFVFWQVFHVFDVLKHNVQRGKSLHWSMAVDALLVLVAGYAVFSAVDLLVAWIPKTGSGPFVFANLGWLSGLLMVLPNALLALYYAHARRADIVYSSQIGDGHICIPMCIGLFALFGPLQVPRYFDLGVITILGAAVIHFLLIAVMGRLPRLVGLALTAAYGFFVIKGLIQ